MESWKNLEVRGHSQLLSLILASYLDRSTEHKDAAKAHRCCCRLANDLIDRAGDYFSLRSNQRDYRFFHNRLFSVQFG